MKSRDKREIYAPDCMEWGIIDDINACSGPSVIVRLEVGELDDWGGAVPFTAMAFLALPPVADEKEES